MRRSRWFLVACTVGRLLAVGGCSETARAPRPAAAGKPAGMVFDNPVDRKAYVAPGGWRDYEPEGGVAPVAKGTKAGITQVILLSSQDLVAENTTVPELARFVTAVKDSVVAVMSASKEPGTLAVQFDCRPGFYTVRFASEGKLDSALLRNVYAKVASLPALRVTKEPISFEVQFWVLKQAP